MYPIRNLKKTCDSCPSQWQAESADDGALVYARFRSDWFYVTIGGAIFHQEYNVRGEPSAGYMSTEEMLERAGLVEIDWREQSTKLFHKYLALLGYDVPPESHVFQVLFDLYMSDEWGETVETEFAPVWVWDAKAEALLEPFKRVSM